MEASWNRATPSYHPFVDGMFHYKNHPFWDPPILRNPQMRNTGTCWVGRQLTYRSKTFQGESGYIPRVKFPPNFHQIIPTKPQQSWEKKWFYPTYTNKVGKRDLPISSGFYLGIKFPIWDSTPFEPCPAHRTCRLAGSRFWDMFNWHNVYILYLCIYLYIVLLI